jgi:phytoene dehydrogenase-like protein
MTMSSADYLDEWFEFDALKATKSASGIIGTFLGPRSPGSAYVLLHHYMGEIDGAFRAWGFQKGGTGAISEAIASAARAHGAEIRTERAVGARDRARRRARPAWRSRRRGDRARVVCRARSAAHVHASSSSPKELPDDLVEACALQVPRLVGQGEPRASGLPTSRVCPARARTCAARSRSARASTTSSARTTTRSTASSRAPVHGHRDPVDDRSGMAPPGKHVMSIFVQYAPYS